VIKNNNFISCSDTLLIKTQLTFEQDQEDTNKN